MKKQVMAIGMTTFLFLLVIFSYTNGGFSDSHTLPIEENNVNSMQGTNPGVGDCSTCETENDEYAYPVMRPDPETLAQWVERYNNAPKTITNTEPEAQMKVTLGGSNFSLLSHLDYTPNERNQGNCGNCWAWAGTGVLGIALDAQERIKDRLSVQYINSCESSVIGKTCCDGGWLYDLADFYENTSKAIPWSNANASWQDGDASCDTGCGTISTNPRYPITSINEETIITHDVTNETAIANIKSVLNQNKAVWFAFFVPTSTNWTDFCVFWNNGNESSIYDIDQSCGIPYSTGGGHAVLCVGWEQTDPANPYWIMLNSWGNITNRPNGLFRIDMDMNYSGTYPGLGVDGNNYSFYWQTLNVTFDIEIPKVVTNTSTNIEETTATLRGTLLNNGSNDTTCYFLWNTTDDFEFSIGNKSVGIIAEGELFSHNILGLSKGQMYFFKTLANNSNGWNAWSNVESFLTKPDPLTSFNATMTNSSKTILTWTNEAGGDGAYIEFAKGSQPSPWNVGNGTTIDDDGYVNSPFNHTNLSSNTHYYYKAWAYAENGEWKSSGNTTAPFGDNPQIENNKTNALPTITSEFPSDNDTEIDKMQPTVNATIEDPDGDNINWTIHGMNIFLNSLSSDTNGSKSANLDTPLPYDTNIIWYVNATDGYDWTNKTYNFTTRSEYLPDAPISLNATPHNRTQINLTWTKGDKTDKTYIRYKQGSTPPTNRTDGTFLYNDTGTIANLSGLNFGIQYSFKAWSWNSTDSVWSATNATDDATTDVNTAPSYGTPSPANNSTNQEIFFIWSIEISDADGDTFNWSINCSNGNTTSLTNDSDGVKNLSISGLDYNTTYTVWVNATDSYDWARSWFTFKTRDVYTPDTPNSFTATTYDTTQVNLTWTKGSDADKTYIERNSTEKWSSGSGNSIYNGTGTNYEDTDRNPHTQYFYQAWSWNQTDCCFSLLNSTDNITTGNSLPSTDEESPTNESTGQSIRPTCNITVTDGDNDSITVNFYENTTGDWVLQQTNDSVESGTNVVWDNFTNANSFSTVYNWSVNITDGYNWTNETYYFITRDQYMPNPPDNFTANSKGKSRIDLSWIKGDMADKTYIRYKQGSTPPTNRTDGGELGNYSGESSSATGLNSGKKYSFKTWSWNDTDNCWSTSNATSSATTDSGGSSTPPATPSEDETTEDEDQTAKDEVENLFNITLDQNFSADDTDGNGVLELDDFDDPNGILDAERLVNISGNSTYLISVNGSKEDIFIWDTEADAVTEVTYCAGTVESTATDTKNNTITITVSVNKSDWVYIEIIDEHPDIFNLTVKTSDGKVISSDMTFRENGKIYVLDDPDTEYVFIYGYAILSPIFNPVSGATFNISKPTISIIYNETLTVVEATLNGEPINITSTIITVTSANKHTFIYTPETDLTNGIYTLGMTVKDDENNSRTDTATYTINAEPNATTPTGEFPWMIVIAIIAIIALIIIVLFKTGNLYFGGKPPEK
jgi:hypothetical protein